MMNKEIDVVFMCGGRGKRMGYLSDNQQKCMLSYEDKPILAHLLEAASSAFGRFHPILSVSYRPEDVFDYFGTTYNGLDISYVYDHGQSNEVKILTEIRKNLSGTLFLLIHGNLIVADTLLANVHSHQDQFKPLATLSLAQKINVSNHAVARVDGNGITDIIIPAPDPIPDGYYRDMGVNGLGQDIFNIFNQAYLNGQDMYIISLLRSYLHEGRVEGVVFGGHWLHFETPKDLPNQGGRE